MGLNARHAWWLAFGSASLLALGCARESERVYVNLAELAERPALHREQIETALSDYFGTPANPRLRVPAAANANAEAANMPEVALTDKVDRAQLKRGALVYAQQCLACHGVTGDGQGPAAAYFDPPPRDYRKGKFKFISGARDHKPRREDLVRIIRYGAKGTAMPSFRWISNEDLTAVIDYLVLLSCRGEMEERMLRASKDELDDDEKFSPALVAGYMQRIMASWDSAGESLVLPLTPPLPNAPSHVEAGAKLFITLDCYKCHGKDGRGNRAYDVGKDAWGRTAYAANIAAGMLHGGRRPVDIYRRIYAGINATPMPAFGEPNTAQGETREQRSEKVWQLVQFITSLVEGQEVPLPLQAEMERLAAEKERAALGGAAPPAPATP